MYLGLFPIQTPCNCTIVETTDLPVSMPLQTLDTLLGYCSSILSAIFVAFILITFLIIMKSIPNAFLICFPNIKGREIGLIGNAMMGIGTFGMAAGLFLDLYNIESWLFYIFPIIFFLGSNLIDRSSIPNLVQPISSFIIFLASIALTLIVLLVNPQTQIPTCHPQLNLLIGAHVVIISLCLTGAICNFCTIQEILHAEKLYLKKDGKVIGYAVKKAEQWAYYDGDDSDKKELICNV